ncbi:tyrosine-protein kinase-like otk [Drosophila guanche]|uniref:Tyrosine-protein kinase-like otk n=1 Tax=Drosophila guanche TaxID=7266 RepID=A0A3B0J300_DROGU|nr:tyrosine-protein kinase-like otk [Drosophila guanche]SPP75635.1 blast:Tyrosine-protein kinase-like otk [Drosophila guanche]
MDMDVMMMMIWICILASTLMAPGWAEANTSRFLRVPQSQSIVENEAVDFDCEATDPSSYLHYEWLHNGREIAYDKRVYRIGSHLHIEAVQREEDVGDYVCIATSLASGAREASPPAKLSVMYLESASVQLLGSNRNELLLKCHVEGASGDEPLQIEWYRDSARLSSWGNVHLEQHRLLVRQPSASDDGLYRCTASNAAGRVMSKQGYVYQANIKCLPRLLKKNQKLPESWSKQTFLCRGKRGGSGGLEQALSPAPEDLRIVQGPAGQLLIKEGDPAALSCLYELPAELQNQRIQLRWRKDGKLLRHVELGGAIPIPGYSHDSGKDALLREDGRLLLHKQNGTLSFGSIIASDAGQYQCQLQLEGHAPLNSSPGTLEVIEQLKFMPQPTSKNLELDAAVAKVHCKAQGTPQPQVQWQRDGTGNSSLPNQVEVDINGTLIFRNVRAEHRGNYTCLASSSQGQINATVAINVVVTPKFSVPPEGPIETTEQGTVVMHCQAIGDPRPTIQWDKDLKYLSENNTDRDRFSFLENGTLEIRNVQVEDEGSYGCTIGNSAGLKREDVQLVVRSTGDGFAPEETGGDGFLVTRAVLITMTVALAYIVLVVGLMLWCRYRRQARKARLNELSIKEAGGDQPDATVTNGKGSEQEPCLSSKQRNGQSQGKSKSNGDAQKSDDTACSQQSRSSKKSVYEQLVLPRSGLSELLQIGRGEFGDVFVGKLKGSLVAASATSDKDGDTDKQHSNSENGSGGSGSGSGSGSTTLSTLNEKRRSKTSMDDIEEIKEEEPEQSALDQLVLVKALNKVKDEQACQEFRRQLDLLRSISHKGVVRLFGLCREKDPHYMVLEYTDWGDLKQFLLATAGKVNTATATSSPPPLTTSQVLAVAYQIARGMDAIYRARCTHRDLATRNCVISSEFIVKVSYPALCKDKYSREYHKHRNALLPVRWMAPECIQEDEYTTKSDIFAYGVVVWELFNQATKLPQEELTSEQVIQRSQAGTLEWTVAEATPDSLKEILLSCWLANPKERPSFSQLGSALSKAMQSGAEK